MGFWDQFDIVWKWTVPLKSMHTLTCSWSYSHYFFISLFVSVCFWPLLHLLLVLLARARCYFCFCSGYYLLTIATDLFIADIFLLFLLLSLFSPFFRYTLTSISFGNSCQTHLGFWGAQPNFSPFTNSAGSALIKNRLRAVMGWSWWRRRV